jgi:hypothetical protein
LRVRFAVLADYSNITQEGKINIMGAFDFIWASAFPARHPEMQLIVRFEADTTERKQQKKVQVRFINERGEKILELNGRITVGDPGPGQMLFFNHVLRLRNITFPTAGDYQFDIYIDDNLAHSVPFKAVQLPQAHKA